MIEDNAYDPIWFEKPPTVIVSDPAKTIRIGSLSKIVSPDYRLGFIRADDEVLKQLRSHKINNPQQSWGVECEPLKAVLNEGYGISVS